MSLYEILDLIASQRGLTVEAWGMFITVHLSIIGGLFFVNRRVSVLERVVAYGIYTGFLYINFRAQIDNYGYLAELIAAADAVAVPGEGGRVVANIYTMPDVVDLLPIVYGFGAVCTLLVVFSINAISMKATPPLGTTPGWKDSNEAGGFEVVR